MLPLRLDSGQARELPKAVSWKAGRHAHQAEASAVKPSAPCCLCRGTRGRNVDIWYTTGICWNNLCPRNPTELQHLTHKCRSGWTHDTREHWHCKCTTLRAGRMRTEQS